MIVQRRCEVWRIIQCGAFGPATSTRIALQILLNIPVLGRGVNFCIVSPRIKKLRSQLCFLSLPPSITVVSEKDNLINNNKKYKYYSTLQWRPPVVKLQLCVQMVRNYYASLQTVRFEDASCERAQSSAVRYRLTHLCRTDAMTRLFVGKGPLSVVCPDDATLLHKTKDSVSMEHCSTLFQGVACVSNNVG